MKWEPIETAPRGMECLFYQPAIKAGRMDLGARMIVERGKPTHNRPTTHWMPLPAPPEAP